MLLAISFGSLAGLVWLFVANQGKTILIRFTEKCSTSTNFYFSDRTKKHSKKIEGQKYR